MNYSDFVRDLYLKEVEARTPKGETIPQTLEILQALRYKDGEVIMEQAKAISGLQATVNKLQRRLGTGTTVWDD